MGDASSVPEPRSFLRNTVPITLFILLCGIVGPIFLVVGLATDGPDAAWLIPIGLLITALDVGIGVTIGWFRTQAQHKSHRLHTRGRRARAQVLSFEDTNVTINDKPVMLIRLRIHGGGVTTFEAEDRQVIAPMRMPLLHSPELPVLVDPETLEWEIDWDSARPVAAWTPASENFPPESEQPEHSAAERLSELDDLMRQDLITPDEYDATRVRILGEI